MHTGQNYDGYALTNMGYDYLVLKVFMKRKLVKQVGLKIGVGKESDIYVCTTYDEERPTVIIKFARLGRTCFRTVKDNRDYLRKGAGCHSWLYMSRLASLKEYAFMKVLYEKGFPTPVPIDSNRHGICMSLIEAYPMTQVSAFINPRDVYQKLIDLIIKLAEHGLVHGDFNEFNLMIDDEEKVTMIDFPQMLSTSHPNARYYFERDVGCVQTYFTKHYGLQFEGMPILDTDIDKKVDLDLEVKASGFAKEQFGEKDLDAVFDSVTQAQLGDLQTEEDQEDDEESEDEQEEADENPSQNQNEEIK